MLRRNSTVRELRYSRVSTRVFLPAAVRGAGAINSLAREFMDSRAIEVPRMVFVRLDTGASAIESRQPNYRADKSDEQTRMPKVPEEAAAEFVDI